MKKDDTNQVNRKSRKSKKKKDDVNVLVREANIETESVIMDLREETAQCTCEKSRIRSDTLRRVRGGLLVFQLKLYYQMFNFYFILFYFSDYLPILGFTGYTGYFIYFIYYFVKYCKKIFSNKTPSSNELRNIKKI